MLLSLLANLTSEDYLFNQQSKVAQWKLNIIGIYCSIVLFTSVLANLFVIWWFFCRNKKEKTNLDYLILSLTIVNTIVTCVKVPVVATNAFHGGFIFGKIGCYTEGFFMYFCGCLSIYTQMVISLERYFMISSPLETNSLKLRTCILLMIVCVFLSALWAVVPFFGWSYYTLEGANIMCSVKWNEKTYNVISYNITIFVFVYVFPLIVLLASNLKLIHLIRVNRKCLQRYNNNYSFKQIIKQESRQSINTVIVTAWTPYSLVSMYSAFSNKDFVNPLISTVPSIFALLSLLWLPIVSIMANKPIRKDFIGIFKCLKNRNTLHESGDNKLIETKT